MHETRRPFNVYELLFFILLFLVIVGTVAGAAFYYGMVRGNYILQSTKLTPSPVQQQGATPSGTIMPSAIAMEPVDFEDKSLVTPGPNTVSIARHEGNIYLLYRDKVYTPSTQQGELTPIENVNKDDYTWFALVNAPDFVPPGEFMFDEVFDLRLSPNERDVVFIMRWGPKTQTGDTIEYYLYYYSPTRPQKLELLRKFTPSQKYEGGYYVPKLDNFNNIQPELFTMNLFPCWNCGGGKPAILLADALNKHFTFLGPVSFFEWTGNQRIFNYKEYKEVECDGPTMGPCSENPDNLPMKTGEF